MAYTFSFWTCYVLYKEYRQVAKMRLQFIASEKRRPDQFTELQESDWKLYLLGFHVLVRNVPPDSDESTSELVEHFFLVNHPDHYLSNQSRFDILKIHSRKMNLMRGIDLKKIAAKMNTQVLLSFYFSSLVCCSRQSY